MTAGPTNSQLDLSAGDNPFESEANKANELLEDAASRRGYRRYSFFLAVLVVGFFGWLLFNVAGAVINNVTSFSPWVVGMFATLAVAMAVITLALLRATFAPPGGDDAKEHDNLPQVSVLSDALKVMGDAVTALRSSVGK
jgi:cytochrome bd-type quinol oxidase subunit 2